VRYNIISIHIYAYLNINKTGLKKCFAYIQNIKLKNKYIYICICIFINININIHICVNIYRYKYKYIYIYIHIHIYIYIYRKGGGVLYGKKRPKTEVDNQNTHSFDRVDKCFILLIDVYNALNFNMIEMI
jgi:hypothetical protein